jgi:ATP-dependent Clp protease ATP-binding subunit ClpA
MNGMFTDRVKKVMQIAREESVRLGNDYVGTQHLLLGLIKEGDGVAVAVMRGMGIDTDELAESIERTVTSAGGMMTIGQMLPFTPRAKKVLELAANEARAMSHKYIGTEHLLLGLIKEGDGVAVAVMRGMGIDTDELTESIERAVTSAGGMMTISQMLPFTPRAKKVLELAANEARAMSHKYIGTEHLLLALMKDTESAAANALGAAGLEYDRVKEEIGRVLKGGEVSGAPLSKEKSKTPFMDHFGDRKSVV